ncbi:MAG: NYN domain-containing protein [Nanoarchaeota archaeon]
MPKHADQRVGIFIDVQNMYYSAKQLYNAKVNFSHILKRAVAGRKLIRAIAYVIKADIKEEHNFFEALEKIGYDVRSKDLQTFFTGAKKGDWDVGIAMDIMRMAAKLDVIVLVSGDGDFKDLLEHVKALGCRAEVISFGKTSSSRLTAEADEVIDLGKELDKVLIKGNSKVFRTDTKATANVVSSTSPNNTTTPVTTSPNNKPYRTNTRSSAPNNKPNNYNKKSYNDKKPYDRNRDQRDSSSDSASLLQKINMEQPDLEPKKDSALVMPKEAKQTEIKQSEKPAKKAIAKKTAKKPVKKAPTTKKK